MLDFEVCCYGYYLFDVGCLLHELAQNQQHACMQEGTLMSLIDIVTWVCTLEPWMQSAWGAKLAERAVVQIQQALTQIPTVS
jgi:hypothetical protein